jgi:hypothetical protein
VLNKFQLLKNLRSLSLKRPQLQSTNKINNKFQLLLKFQISLKWCPWCLWCQWCNNSSNSVLMYHKCQSSNNICITNNLFFISNNRCFNSSWCSKLSKLQVSQLRLEELVFNQDWWQECQWCLVCQDFSQQHHPSLQLKNEH